MRRPKNVHLPFDMLTALSEAEGLRYPHPSSLWRTSMWASFLGISETLHLNVFHQPLRRWFFDVSLAAKMQGVAAFGSAHSKIAFLSVGGAENGQ